MTQLEISSTELRALIIAGRDPRYLVPDAVRQIILETRCYAPATAARRNALTLTLQEKPLKHMTTRKRLAPRGRARFSPLQHVSDDRAR